MWPNATIYICGTVYIHTVYAYIQFRHSPEKKGIFFVLAHKNVVSEKVKKNIFKPKEKRGFLKGYDIYQ